MKFQSAINGTKGTNGGGRKSATHQTRSNKSSTSHKYNREYENARKSTTYQTPRGGKEPAKNQKTIKRTYNIMTLKYFLRKDLRKNKNLQQIFSNLLNPNTTQEKQRKLFLSLLLKYHPNKTKTSSNQFRRIHQLYEKFSKI